MKSISILTRIENGKLKRNSKLVKSAIEKFEGKEIEIIFKRKYAKRSIPQNSFYWGVLIPLFQELINDNWGEIIRVPQSTTILTTTGFMEYNQKLKQLAMDYFNTVLPEPGEQLTMDL